MLPTTLAGVVLFLVFLLPGFAYTLNRERHRPVRRLSAFRESTQTVFASAVACSAFVLMAAVGSFGWKSLRVQLAQGIASPGGYLQTHPLRGLLVGLAYLAIATSLCALGGSRSVRTGWRRLRNLQSSDPAGSAWWVLFESRADHDKLVGVSLDDGSWVGGTLRSWSRDADETEDRELTVQSPIYLRNVDSDEVHRLDHIAAMTISARRIRYLTVEYVRRSKKTLDS